MKIPHDLGRVVAAMQLGNCKNIAGITINFKRTSENSTA